MPQSRKLYGKPKMIHCYVEPVIRAAIFKMADVTTEFSDCRQWQHLKRPGTTESISNNKMNAALESQKNVL